MPNPFDVIVVGAGNAALSAAIAARESCPVFPGARRILHRGFEDPDYPWMSERELADVFRRVRDEIGSFCRALVAREITGA